jgi:hypothetical protein
MKKIFLVLISVLLSFFCNSQQAPAKNKIELDITGRSYADHIVLRYAPATPILFDLANKAGYIIERANYIQGVSFEKLSYTALKGSPFKRWSEQQWEKAVNEQILSDSTAANLTVLAMAYSEPDSASSPGDIMKDGLKSLKEHKNNADLRYGFALIAANRSKMAAEGLAVSVIDQEVAPGQTYVYRVHINRPVINPLIEMSYVKVTCENFNEKYLRNDKAVNLTEGDGMITFSFPESSEYYAFTTERSDDEGVSYKKIIKTPILNFKPAGFDGKSGFAYHDTSLTNYRKYHYRILVSTVFADELLLSEFVAIPRDKTPPPSPFLKSAIHIKPKQVELHWEMTGKPKDDLKGFTVKRGTEENGTYSMISKGILPKTTNSYIDEGFDPEGSNYYIVEAVDTAGNSSRSFPAYVTLIDTIPPAIPTISSAKIDSLGKITINVMPNTERDFMGYQVLKANSKEHEFSVILETFKDTLGRTTFTMNDSTTLNTLTKNIYYKVVAFDTHYNQSAPSKIIELTKRDTIPPVSPLITGFAINDTSVILSFANSSSEDAIQNIILRRENGKTKFDTVFLNTNIQVTRFTDKNIVGGRQYEYAMIAKDDGGLSSKISKSIYLRTLLNKRLPAPVLQGAYDDKAKKISLSFVIDDKLNKRKLKVEIFKRSDKKSVWIAYKMIDYEKGKMFSDDIESNQKEMIYAVRLTDENKNSSNFSNELQLKF